MRLSEARLLRLMLPIVAAALLAGLAGSSDPETGSNAEPPDSESAAGAPAQADSDEEPAGAEGRRIYLEHNCALCHTAYDRGIGEPEEASEAGGDEKDESAGAAMPGGPPDLSTLGEAWTEENLRAYLVDREPIDGEKHVTGFRGEDEEWDTLVTWLLTDPAEADTSDAEAAAPEGGQPGEDAEE